MKECNVQACCFVHDHPEDFHKIAFQKSNEPSKILLAFRILQELYNVAMLIWILCLVFIAVDQKVYIFFCIWAQWLWGFTMEAVLLKNYIVSKFEDRNRTTLPWYLKMYWALFSALLPTMVLTFIIFWSQMFDGKTDPLFIVTSNVTPFLTLCEFIMIAYPLRLLHFFYFIIFCLIYIIFTVIYQKLGGTGIKNSVPIFKYLDWRYPETAVLTCFIAILIGEVAYICFWGINKLKLRDWENQGENETTKSPSFIRKIFMRK